jgi:hypothetical protein
MTTTGSNALVVPTTGTYNVSLNLLWQTGGNRAPASADNFLMLYRNGTQIRQWDVSTSANSWIGICGSDDVSLTAGDSLQMYAYQGCGGNLGTYAGIDKTFLSAHLLTSGPVGATGPAGPMGTVTSVVAGRAYRNAAFTSSSAWTTIPMDTFSGLGAYDNGGNFNHTTGAYVCPQTGYYAVYGEMTYDMPSGAPLLAGIYQNGTLATIGSAALSSSAGQALFECVSDVLHCNAGDTLMLASYTGAAAPMAINAGQANYLSVTLLSAGPTGPTGPAGAAGATGPAGPTGPQGPAGPAIGAGAVIGMTVNSTYTQLVVTTTANLATALAVTFIAPSSGQVTVRMGVAAQAVYTSLNGWGQVTAQMYSGGSPIGAQQVLVYNNATAALAMRTTFEQLYTGLTPGQSYTFTPYFVGGNGNTAYVMWGSTGAIYWGPAEVRVFAA